MNHAQLVDLATAIHGLRPDWQQPGIVAQLKTLDATWPGTTPAFYVHAVTIAANPKAETPAAFNILKTAQPTTEPKTSSREPLCYICGNTRSRCYTIRNQEERHGLETHEYESRDDAEQRSTNFTK